MTSSPSSHRPSAAEPATGLLAGKTIAVTASRRIQEQVAAFERQGARVLVAPTVRIVPVADDTELHAATDHVLAHHPDVLLVTTGYGLIRSSSCSAWWLAV